MGSTHVQEITFGTTLSIFNNNITDVAHNIYLHKCQLLLTHPYDIERLPNDVKNNGIKHCCNKT